MPQSFKLYSSKTRTENYLRHIEKWMKARRSDAALPFPSNMRNDILLILAPQKIYQPFVDRKYHNRDNIQIGGHIARRYFVKGLEFLKNQPARISGESDVNYYAPHMEGAWAIMPQLVVPYPLEVIWALGGKRMNKDPYIVSELKQLKKGAKAYVDMYEWDRLVRFPGGKKAAPSHIWIPHPDGRKAFRQMLSDLIKSKATVRKLEGALAKAS